MGAVVFTLGKKLSIILLIFRSSSKSTLLPAGGFL
jgi:hypothetical protein